MNEKIKQALENLKIIRFYVGACSEEVCEYFKQVEKTLNDFDRYHESQQDLIKGKDEYITKLCCDRAELKAELKELKDACEKGILKDKVICNVNLHYYLTKTNEVFNKLKAISNHLEDYNIQSDIVVGNHWGECWEFSAKGTTTLEIAEYICNFIHSKNLHAKIGYDNNQEFYLSA